MHGLARVTVPWLIFSGIGAVGTVTQGTEATFATTADLCRGSTDPFRYNKISAFA